MAGTGHLDDVFVVKTTAHGNAIASSLTGVFAGRCRQGNVSRGIAEFFRKEMLAIFEIKKGEPFLGKSTR